MHIKEDGNRGMKTMEQLFGGYARLYGNMQVIAPPGPVKKIDPTGIPVEQLNPREHKACAARCRLRDYGKYMHPLDFGLYMSIVKERMLDESESDRIMLLTNRYKSSIVAV